MATTDPASTARQAYLARLRSREGIRDFGISYFQKAGSDPFRNRFTALALQQAENELPTLMDLYGVDDNTRESRVADYFSGAWNPSGREILAERDRLGQLEGSIFATGNIDKDQAAWMEATRLGRQDLGERWQDAYTGIEQKRAGAFNAMVSDRAASNNPWEGAFSAWRMGLPGLTGSMPGETQPGGGTAPVPGSTPAAPGTTPAPATTTPTPTTPGTTPPGTTPPGTTPPAATPPPTPLAPFSVSAANGVATLSGGTPDQVRKWMQENRSPTGHPDAPAISSFRIGPYLYQAPRDTARKFKDSNGNGRYMGSGFNKLLERSDLLMSQGVAKNWYEAMTQAIDWIISRGPGFGFTRVA